MRFVRNMDRKIPKDKMGKQNWVRSINRMPEVVKKLFEITTYVGEKIREVGRGNQKV